MSEEERRVLDSQKPALPDGYLTVKVVSQTIKIRGVEYPVPELNGKLTVAVQGPRFNLLPQDVASVYPPPGGTVHHGSTTRVIPHLMLTRTTLPWERTPDGNAQGGEPRPWLALLVIDQIAAIGPDPENFSHRTGVPEINAPDGVYSVPRDWEFTAKTFHAPSLPGSPWKAQEAMQLMKLKWDRAKTLLPSWEDLRLLAHVRQTRKEDGTSRSVILASPKLVTGDMLQPQHRLSVHLVSLENWYRNSALVPPPAQTTPVLLVVLKSWAYTSAKIEGSSIEAIFGALKKGADVLRIGNTPRPVAPAPAKPVSDVERFQSRGFAILPHLRRSGGVTVSFYRGPLAPWAGANDVRLSSDLVPKYSEFGLSDITDKAARELGRLLMLHDLHASREFMNWKMQQLQQAEQARLAKSRRVHRVDHLPVKSLPTAPFPQEWFDRLLTLEGIPFGYLVPDERMLPRKPKEETVRFFEIERAWMEALVSGVFSVGPSNAAIEDRRKTICNQILSRGFLLRSSIVSDWPQLHFTPEPDPKTHIVRRLSADVELHLFSASVATVTMAVPREALHFEWPPHSGPHSGKSWSGHTLQSSSDFAIGCLHTGRELTFNFPAG